MTKELDAIFDLGITDKIVVNYKLINKDEMKIINDVNDGLYNLLTPNIDKHLISLYNPTPELLIQVTRIELIISN